MRTKMHSLLLLISLAVLSCMAGCANIEKPDVEEVITGELDLLKNLDLKTTQKYISYKELFPDASKTSTLPKEVEEVFSLFFQNFDYKILSLNVKEETATAKIRLQTIDAQALARDFAAERLKQHIADASQYPRETEENSDNSLQAHYLLLNKLLKNNEYKTVETNCTMHLVNNNDTWLIKQDRSLENELVGGFITYISNPNLLNAKESLQIYMDAMCDMDTKQLANYLGLLETLHTNNAARKALANELMEQIHKYFDYQIVSCTENEYTAQARIKLTTMDAEAILDRYEKQLSEYLATAEAVIAGSEGRTLKSQELLLKQIIQNTKTTTAEVTVDLINDGILWQLQLDGEMGDVLLDHLVDARLLAETKKELTEETSE